MWRLQSTMLWIAVVSSAQMHVLTHTYHMQTAWYLMLDCCFLGCFPWLIFWPSQISLLSDKASEGITEARTWLVGQDHEEISRKHTLVWELHAHDGGISSWFRRRVSNKIGDKRFRQWLNVYMHPEPGWDEGSLSSCLWTWISPSAHCHTVWTGSICNRNWGDCLGGLHSW